MVMQNSRKGPNFNLLRRAVTSSHFDIKPEEFKCVRKESDGEVYLGMSHLTDVSFCQ